MSLIDYMTNGLLEKETGQKRQIVTFAAMYKEQDYTYSLYLKIFEAVCVMFYPLALGLGFPIVMQFLAQEKEEQVKSLLEINGMKSFKYWLSTYTFFIVFLSCTSFIFYIAGYFLLDDGFFHRISVFSFILFIFLWNSNQIAVSIFLLSFINSSGTASAVGYFISIVFCLFFVNINQMIYVFPTPLPDSYKFLPIAPFTRIIHYFLIKGDNINTPAEDAEYLSNMNWLFVTAIVYMFLGMMMNEKRFKNKVVKVLKFIFRIKYNSNEVIQASEIHESSKEMQDSIQRESINLNDYAVVCKDIEKIYTKNGKKFKALNKLNLFIEKEEIFGLLGPNGAGKTTLISIICGFVKRDAGEIFIQGESMVSSHSSKNISLCPQFDILWSSLTVYEHFKFFGMMRGLEGPRLESTVADIAKKVELSEFMDNDMTQLSGGMKRRCSLGIALMGDIDLVFLDEPSTGLDPKKRRAFWKMIIELQKTKTFVISTHLMEEAEFLCSKIGIVNKGTLKAVGNSAYLKKTFCNWKILEVTFDVYNEEVEKEILEEFNAEIEYKFNKLLKVRIDSTANSYSKLMEFLEQKKDSGIKNWSVKKANLEDVFGKIKERYV